MDSSLAFEKGAAACVMGSPTKVFDWNTAAKLIAERGETDVDAGLVEDWFWTGGGIVKNGEFVVDELGGPFLASNWATPVLRFADGDEVECYVLQNDAPGWNAGTRWPDSAREIYAAVKNGAADQQ